MKTLKNPQLFIPVIIIIIALGWIGYQKLGKKQPLVEQKINIEGANPVDENTDESLSNDQAQTNSATAIETAVDIAGWRSFTHRSYHYTISFPPEWYWNGTQVDTLIISKEPINSPEEPFLPNNLKIVDIQTETDSAKVNEYNLPLDGKSPKFKAVWLKKHNDKEIVGQIAQSFKYK